MNPTDPHTNPDPLHLQLARSLDGREETRQDALLGFLASYKSAAKLRAGGSDGGFADGGEVGAAGFVAEETVGQPGMQLITGDETPYGEIPDADASRRMWSVIEAGMSVERSGEGTVAGSMGDDRRAEAVIAGTLGATAQAGGRKRSRSGTSFFAPFLRAAAVLAVVLLGGLMLYSVVRPSEALLISAADAIETYTLPDGSVLTVRPNSAVYASKADPYAFRLEGEALFTVAKNPDRTFSVATTDALVEVTGTRFVVRTTHEATEVFLEEGGVRVSVLESGEQQLMEPQQALRVGEEGASWIDLVRADYYLLWTQNEMLLDGRSLADITGELERHFGIRVELGPELAEETLDGQLVLDEPSRILEDIALLLGVRLEIADNTYILN